MTMMISLMMMTYANSDDDPIEEERFSMLPTQKLFRPLGWWVAGDITTVSVGLSRPLSPTLGAPWDRIIIQTPTGCITRKEIQLVVIFHSFS